MDASNGQTTYLNVVALEDGTEVEIIPSVDTMAGDSVPAGTAGVPFFVTMDEGDLLQVAAVDGHANQLTGTFVQSDEDHPIAVFAGASCALVPHIWSPEAPVGACDHLQAQLTGPGQWGQNYVAARMPVRNLADPAEYNAWQIMAALDGTTVSFVADPAVTGLPDGDIVLDGGEVFEAMVTGPLGTPGDFIVTADQPISVVSYMIGANGTDTVEPSEKMGDPSMVQLSPQEQFLTRYVILVPTTWETDIVTIVRPAGTAVTLDDAVLADELFMPVGTEFEVARIPIEDGVHTLYGDSGIGIQVVGMSNADSYAYLGGTGTEVFNDPIVIE